MENPGRLFGQIAAEAGITEAKAKVALYLMGLAEQGRSLDYAAGALQKKPSTVRTYARDFLIDFADFRPFAKQRDKGEVIEPRARLNVGAA
ncbi:hypothetical protein [Sphingomonas sp.]|uniref:hypothetical protein n=1 Tax=Sphingomonas sp. TaxID=28214 RepID=UPI003B3A4FDF